MFKYFKDLKNKKIRERDERISNIVASEIEWKSKDDIEGLIIAYDITAEDFRIDGQHHEAEFYSDMASEMKKQMDKKYDIS